MQHERIACINCGEVIADDNGTSSREVARLYRLNKQMLEALESIAGLRDLHRGKFSLPVIVDSMEAIARAAIKAAKAPPADMQD